MGGKGSGGPNGGPQYNPMNISSTGGDGQSGTQAAKYIPGMREQGVTSQEVYNTQTQAPLAGDPTASLRTGFPQLPSAIPLDAPSLYPERDASYGNTSDLNLPTQNILQEPDSGLAAIRVMYLRDPRNEDLRRILAIKSKETNI